MPSIAFNVRFRPHQLQIYNARKRFDVRVLHRRGGKTWQSCAELITDALPQRIDDWRGYYIAPTYKQAKAIAWDYLSKWSKHLPGADINIADLAISYHNGARIQLLGAEQADSLRGRYADAMVVDEAALIASSTWSTVLSPMLSDREGWAVLQGTPMGRLNLFFEQYEYAISSGDPEYHGVLMTYRDTNALPAKEVERLRRTMREEEFAQELECSFNAAIRGSFYMKEMAGADQQGRITQIRYESELPVIAAVDLGWSDLMVAGFFQITGTEHRVIACRAYERTKISDMLHDWKTTLPFPVEAVILPHDAKVSELGTGKTRQEIFEAFGTATYIAPKLDIHEGIEQVRIILPHVWWDKGETQTLREAMLAYRSEFDEVRNVHKVTPIHDWSSHYADMMRYYALGYHLAVGNSLLVGPQPRSSFYRRRAVA